MQMEALIVEHREEGVGLCPVLVEYRASGRGERTTEGKCSDGQLAAVQRQVQVIIEFGPWRHLIVSPHRRAPKLRLPQQTLLSTT